VYTSAKSPLDYCDGNESPALQLPVDQNGNVVYDLVVHQGIHFQSAFMDEYGSSTGARRSMQSFDLNQLPTDYDKDFDLNQLPSDYGKGIDMNQTP